MFEASLIIFLSFFLLGLLIGSFINVCIYRIPKEESLVSPGSHCVFCCKPIQWYDNIPLLSFIILGGRCRYCKEKISLQYPLVELITAICFALIAVKFFNRPELSFYLYLTFALITVFFIDYHHQIIPDVFSYSLIIFGIISSLFNEQLGLTLAPRLINSFSGAATGAAILLVIGYFGKLIFKQDAMGMGDVKFLAGIGAFLGFPKVVIILFLASVLGSIYGIFLVLLKKIKKRDYIAFGPFISIAAYIAIFF